MFRADRFLLALTLAGLAAHPSHCATLKVGRGSGFDHPTITAGLAAAASGDTVAVAPSVYNATNGETFPLRPGDHVTLVASPLGSLPWIQGDSQNVTVEYDGVQGGTLQGFRISHGFGTHGGGLRCRFSSPAILDCLFDSNQVVPGGAPNPSGVGHAMYLMGSFARVERCQFLENGNSTFPGGVIASLGFAPVFNRCVIGSNTGTAFLTDGQGRPRLRNCLIALNRNRQSAGFEAAIRLAGLTSIELANCTVVGNGGEGILSFTNLTSHVSNSIFWNNGPEFVGDDVSAIFSCIRGSAPGVGNIAAWPGFKSWKDSDFSLAEDSPCVDRGSNALADPSPSTDISGAPRIQDATVDMGAHEAPAGFAAGATDTLFPIVYVRSGADPGGDGSSWESAFQTIGDGIEDAPNHAEVWIEGGTYAESLNLNFSLTLRGSLVPSATRTIGSPAASATRSIVDATGLESSVASVSNARPVKLIGLKLTGGKSSDGGGIHCFGSDLEVYDCEILDNTTSGDGGGIYAAVSNVTLENCLLRGNTAYGFRSVGGSSMGISGGEGGGIRFSNGGTLRVIRTEIEENTAGIGGSAIHIRSFEEVEVVLSDSTITENIVDFFPLRIGTFVVDGIVSATMSNTDFLNNSAPLSMSGFENATLLDQGFRSNSRFRLNDCRIEDNTGLAGVRGVEIEMEDCVVARNGLEGIVANHGIFHRCVIEDNAQEGVELRRGGEFVDCRIAGNGSTGVVDFLFSNEPLDEIHMLRCEVYDNGKIPAASVGFPRPGGISISHASVTLDESIFAGNSGYGSSAGGIGLANVEGTIRRCRVERNTGEEQTGGCLFWNSDIRMESCQILANSATSVFFSAGNGIDSSNSNLTMVNSVVTGNTGGGQGGVNIQGGDLTAINCTIQGNERAGIRGPSAGNLRLLNTIVWNGTGGLTTFGFADVDIRYCDTFDPAPGEGNISQDPLFLQPWDGENGDVRLPCQSPCVDAGTAEGAPFTDFEGNRRPRGGGVDMGAYENCLLDLTGDRSEDAFDLLFFPSEWYEPVNETNFVFDYVTGPSETPRIDSLDLLEILSSPKGP